MRALWICVVATAFVVARPDVPAQAVAVFSVNLHSHTGSSSGSGTPLRTEMADVIGAIREKWLKLGGEGFFGHAIDIERPTFDGVGRAQQFSGGGIISWHPAIGAFAVWGQIGAKWVALGREKYGYPITDELTCADGRGRLNHFRSMHRRVIRRHRSIGRRRQVHTRCVARFGRLGSRGERNAAPWVTRRATNTPRVVVTSGAATLSTAASPGPVRGAFG